MWFDDLKEALPRFYTRQYPLNIVGYIRGAGSPDQWRVEDLMGHNQPIILGNELPTRKDWEDAGIVQSKRHQHVIIIQDITGWIVLKNGGSRRPLGQLFEIDDERVGIEFPKSLEFWRQNYG
ncbi:MAG: hypothetical protein ACR2PF_17475 [Rhizobiaceae bacterium]